MNLGYVMTTERGATDRLLSAFATACIERGIRVSGVVQTNTECTDSRLCDMDVQVLPDGPVFRISQSLGKEARGCRLDPAALEEAVAAVTRSLEPKPDLLIVNKFGKHEADGRGFRDIIGRCLTEGVPVLAGVNALNLDAFQGFAGGVGDAVPASLEGCTAWLEAVLADTTRAA